MVPASEWVERDGEWGREPAVPVSEWAQRGGEWGRELADPVTMGCLCLGEEGPASRFLLGLDEDLLSWGGGRRGWGFELGGRRREGRSGLEGGRGVLYTRPSSRGESTILTEDKSKSRDRNSKNRIKERSTFEEPEAIKKRDMSKK